MKVLMLTHEYPPDSIGGIATFCHELANVLPECGVDLTVAAGSNTINVPTIQNHNGSSHLIRLSKVNLPPTHLWYQLMNLGTLGRLIERFDIVQAQDSSAFPLLYLAKKKHPHIPWVVTIHSGPVSELYYALASLKDGGSLIEFARYGIGFPSWDVILRADIKFADEVVPVSHNLFLEIQKRYGLDSERASIIHTGIDVEKVMKMARTSVSGNTSNKVMLFWAGRFSWRKGIVHLLNSLEYLAHDIGFTNFEIQLFGRGPLERKVRELTSHLKLTENIRFRGFVRYEEVISAMASSDIVCFPSLYEACPVGMIEAMALGKPLVVFDRPFSREMLGEIELGPAEDIRGYAKALYSLCNSDELRKQVGASLRARARQFDIKTIAENYVRVYQKILARQ